MGETMILPLLMMFGGCAQKAPPVAKAEPVSIPDTPFDGDIHMELSIVDAEFTEASLSCRGVRDQRPIVDGKVTFYKVPAYSCMLKLLPRSVIVNIDPTPKASCAYQNKQLECQQ
jgi:hypothetical protein